MTGMTFVRRGWWFFRRSYLTVWAAAALGAMVLLGALLAGDSIQRSLRDLAAARVGRVDAVFAGGDRLFRAALANDLAASRLLAAPVLAVKATVTVQHNGRSLGGVQVLGVDRRFWQFSPGGNGIAAPRGREFFVNDYLNRSLGLTDKDALVLRFDKPVRLAGDAPLAGKAAEVTLLTGELHRTCRDAEFGRFSLEVTQLPQPTVWVPIDRLQDAVGLNGMANLLLLGDPRRRSEGELQQAIARHCTLADYGLSVEELPAAKAVEIRTERIFFDRQVAAAIRKRLPAAQPVITYLANTLAVHGKETPYSMVTAVDPAAAPFLPADFKGAVLNAWAADDLTAIAGDPLRLDYYALDADQRLVERHTQLPVAAVVPLTGLAADPAWMPAFPGVAAAEDEADWDPGVPIDLKRLRPKDEAYWDDHRGTPKVFIPLETGRQLFGNRWGEYTALRVPTASASRAAVITAVLETITPALAGLVVDDFRGRGTAAAASPVDFAGLFLGMSLFLMVAAVALTAMLFRFHLDQRNRESALLAALGIPVGKVMRWRMLEALGVVLAGSLAGALLALGYTGWLLGKLEDIWRGKGGRNLFDLHVQPAMLAGGLVTFLFILMAVVWWTLRRQARRPASLRLTAGMEETPRIAVRKWPWAAVAWAIAGGGALVATFAIGPQTGFFLAGCAWLLGGLALYHWVLRRRLAVVGGELTPRRLAELNCGRRAARSGVVVGTLACGVFLVVAVAAFRKPAGDDWQQRQSGAGGFAFWVETTRATNRTHDGDSGDDVVGLGDQRIRFGQVVPLRIGAGTDASCFNLNQVAQPRLLATKVATFATLGAFPIRDVMPGCTKSWNCLTEGETMRAFVDQSTLQWVLKKKLGDQLIYQDEWGRSLPVVIAGTLDDTVFQGNLIVDEGRFLQHFPSAPGPRIFMLEGGADLEVWRAILQRALAEQGAMVTTTRERLAAFHQVENTYISIFQLLGGLGVMLGSAGLGLVTARNLVERRHEFAILHTLGIAHERTRRVVLHETGQLIRWGLAIGLVAALVAILPGLTWGSASRSLLWIGLWLALIAGNAWLWSWLGYRGQLRNAMDARQEFD